MNEVEIDSIKNKNRTKKVAFKTFGLIISFVTILIGYIINMIEPDLAKAIFHNVVYSGVDVIRYAPSVFLGICTTYCMVSLFYDKEIKKVKRFSLGLKLTLLVTFSFFSGAFFKDPFISSTILLKDYHGPAQSIIPLGGLEFRSEDCKKLGKELSCQFVVSNLTTDDLSFGRLSNSMVIDYTASSSELKSFYVGEKKYSKHENGYFIVPKNSNRKLKLFFLLPTDQEMKIIPYLGLSVSGNSSSDRLEFRNIPLE